MMNESSGQPFEDPQSEQSSVAQGRWTDDEHKRFVEALRKYGKDWQQVEDHIGTRNSAQIRSHAQKFLNRIEKVPDIEESDIKDILAINLRSLKKNERPVHINNEKSKQTEP